MSNSYYYKKTNMQSRLKIINDKTDLIFSNNGDSIITFYSESSSSSSPSLVVFTIFPVTIS